MKFRPDPELEAFRQTVRAFLCDKLPPELAYLSIGMFSQCDVMSRWQAILYDQGWAAPGWPVDRGGTGWSTEQRLIFDEECSAAGAPTQDAFAQNLLGPVLNHFATPEQWQEHAPPILKGERKWCQGFSEPGSGSDLASLRTRAERRGDCYVVNGQKIWTTNAHRADWIFLLVRTDPEAKKQAGISFMLVDMKSPGITVRPIWSIDGHHHLNEVFFDDVEVPAANLVGAENMGWSITKFLLNNEHAYTADLPLLKRYRQEIRRLAVTQSFDGKRLVDCPGIAQRIASFETELRAVEMMVQRTAALHGDQGHFAHAMGSMLKLRGTDLQQRMSVFIVELLGDAGAVADGQSGNDLAAEMFFRRASTIYGGSSEVQRGIVAKLMFGL